MRWVASTEETCNRERFRVLMVTEKSVHWVVANQVLRQPVTGRQSLQHLSLDPNALDNSPADEKILIPELNLLGTEAHLAGLHSKL